MDSVNKQYQMQLLIACEHLEHAAKTASVSKDPLEETLSALAATLKALGAIYEASSAVQLDIGTKLHEQADAIAEEAIGRVHASGVNFIDQLAPRLAGVVKQTAKAQEKAVQWRIISRLALGLTLGLAIFLGISYLAGYTSGRSRGEIVASKITQAMHYGPQAAGDWALLMQYNDPIKALAACRQSTGLVNGRKYCLMPVWLEAPHVP